MKHLTKKEESIIVPLNHRSVDVGSERKNHASGLDLLVQDHLGGNGARIANGLGHGRVAILRVLRAVAYQVDASLLSSSIRPPNGDLWTQKKK